MGLTARLTDLWYPDGVGGFDELYDKYEPLVQFTDWTVDIPLDDMRSGSVTMSVESKGAWAALQPFWTLLRMKLDGVPLLWGPITTADWSDSRTVTLHAIGPESRLLHHYLRIGDQALNTPTSTGVDPLGPNPYNKRVPPNGVGIGYIINAAQNFDTQVDDDPPLGLMMGYDDTDAYDPASATDLKLCPKFARGDECWDAITQLVGMQLGPEVEFQPVEGIPGIYAKVNTFKRQGVHDPATGRDFPTGLFYPDDPPRVVFADSCGPDNATITAGPLGKFVTHVHVLDAKGKRRVTVADGTAARDRGIYVHWEQTDYTGDDEVLIERGKQILDAYSVPPVGASVTVKPTCAYKYGRDYVVGTVVLVRKLDGDLYLEKRVRITKVSLKQHGTSGDVEVSLDVIPLAGSAATAGGEV